VGAKPTVAGSVHEIGKTAVQLRHQCGLTSISPQNREPPRM
jgi:hypothetical protein